MEKASGTFQEQGGGPPGGTTAPPEPRVGGQWGDPDTISQPVDPGGVGGLRFANPADRYMILLVYSLYLN